MSPSADQADPFPVNGIDGASGRYLLPAVTLHDLSAVAQGEAPDPAYRAELARWWQRISEERLGTIDDVDATDLSQAGWTVMFPRGPIRR